MAIACPGCGRQYDVTLFAYGRTLECACGEPVGERHERRLGGEPRIEGPRTLFERCLECDTPLVEATPGAVAETAAPRVRRTHDDVRACPDCGRVHWEGSHAERMRRHVRRALGWPAPDDSDLGGAP